MRFGVSGSGAPTNGWQALHKGGLPQVIAASLGSSRKALRAIPNGAQWSLAQRRPAVEGGIAYYPLWGGVGLKIACGASGITVDNPRHYRSEGARGRILVGAGCNRKRPRCSGTGSFRNIGATFNVGRFKYQSCGRRLRAIPKSIRFLIMRFIVSKTHY